MQQSERFFIEGRNPFDIHFYYSEEAMDSALEIRNRMMEKFPFLKFFNPHSKPIGPHTLPFWEADFSNSKNVNQDLGEIIIWLLQNRKNHSVLIHPHTYGQFVIDHTQNAIWLGEKLELNLKIN